jgi:hypothetical protein
MIFVSEIPECRCETALLDVEVAAQLPFELVAVFMSRTFFVHSDAKKCLTRARIYVSCVPEPSPHLHTSFLPFHVTPYLSITRHQHASEKFTRYV